MEEQLKFVDMRIPGVSGNVILRGVILPSQERIKLFVILGKDYETREPIPSGEIDISNDEVSYETLFEQIEPGHNFYTTPVDLGLAVKICSISFWLRFLEQLAKHLTEPYRYGIQRIHAALIAMMLKGT